MLGRFLLIFSGILAAMLSHVSGHSWVECTNYRPGGETNFVRGNCQGWPRCGKRQSEVAFGVDTGLNFNARTCQCSKGQDDLAPSDRAQYTPGQKVCLAYPAKNHVAAECTNKFIPDAGVIIKRSARNSDSDVFTTQYPHQNGDHVNGQIDYKGFQNCPNFCENTDKAMCTMCFDLERDIQPGTYAFSWEWEFNPGSFYTTCWDATVGRNGNVASQATAQVAQVQEADVNTNILPVKCDVQE